MNMHSDLLQAAEIAWRHKKLARECLTPDAQYRFGVNDEALTVSVSFPKALSISEAEAKHLEDAAHDALEKLLAPFWNRVGN